MRNREVAVGGDDEREKTYLASTTIANEDKLESGSLSHGCDASMCRLKRKDE